MATNNKKYRLRYWFEWGCSSDECPCLWGDDDFTKEKYGYSVDLFALPISEDLRSFLIQLGQVHDKALNWEYPPDPLLWTKEEEAAFYLKAKEGHRRLVEELGSNFEIIYCEEK